jgi:hypothetical protein
LVAGGLKAFPNAGHDEVVRALLTELKFELMLADMFLTTVIVPTTIKPTRTAYSTAVGPSSLVRNRRRA